MKLNLLPKLMLGFALVLALSSAANAYSIFQMNVLADLTMYMYEHPVAARRAALAAHVDIIKMHRGMKDLALAGDAAAMDAAWATVNGLEAEVYRNLELASDQVGTPQGQALVEAVRTAFAAWRPIREEVYALMKAGQPAEAAAITQDKGAKQVGLIEASMVAVRDYTEAEATRVYDEARATRASVFQLALVILGAVVVIALALAFFIARSTASAARQMARVADGIARGELEHHITVASRDEMGAMAASFQAMVTYLQAMAGVANEIAHGDLTVTVTPKSERDVLGQAFARMVTRLRAAVSQMAASAHSVNGASEQLAAAAAQAGQATTQIAGTIQQVARGTQQQAESVTRTATSVEQMKHAIDGVARGAQEQAAAMGKTATVVAQFGTALQQVSGNAQAVAQEAAGAAEAAQSGARTVDETIHGMDAIKTKVGLSAQKVREMGQRSDQVGMIVETIDDIASQTNLLALNAAIEAARAGEHGKGFAVVADEVRKLAERASAATKEIGGLIKGIQASVGEAVRAMEDGAREVEAGARRANSAGDALAQILKAAQAVQQQAQAAQQATQQMGALSTELVAATDTVSAVIEENTGATEEMAAGAADVTQSIENIASVSEENRAAVEEVNAPAEQMSQQVGGVTAAAEALASMARTLQEMVAQFRLEAAPAGTRVTDQPPAYRPPAGPYPANGHHQPAALAIGREN